MGSAVVLPPAVFASTHRGAMARDTASISAPESSLNVPVGSSTLTPANGTLPVALSMNNPSASGVAVSRRVW